MHASTTSLTGDVSSFVFCAGVHIFILMSKRCWRWSRSSRQNKTFMKEGGCQTNPLGPSAALTPGRRKNAELRLLVQEYQGEGGIAWLLAAEVDVCSHIRPFKDCLGEDCIVLHHRAHTIASERREQPDRWSNAACPHQSYRQSRKGQSQT